MPDGGNPIGEVLVRGTGISVRHGRRMVLHNVDIQVSRGEIVTLAQSRRRPCNGYASIE